MISKSGWDGIQVLENEINQETKNEQLEIDKTFARTFETEEGRKCLDFLISPNDKASSIFAPIFLR